MTAPPPGPVTDLPVGATAAAAYRAFFAQLRFLPRAVAVPFLMSILLSIAALLIVDLSAFFAILSLVPYTLFGVTWYRLNLFGPGPATTGFGLTWGKPHWQFLRYVILMTLLNLIALPIYAAPLAGAAQAGTGLGLSAAVFSLGVIIALAYVMLRVSFVFPAAAAGEDYGLKHAWRHSTGQGWRLLIGLFFVMLPLIAFMALLAPLISAPFMPPPGEVPSVESMAGSAEEIGSTFAWLKMMTLVFEYLLLAVIMTYISIAFQTCTGWVADQGNLPAVPDEPDKD